MSATSNDLIERGEALLTRLELPNTDANWDWVMAQLMAPPPKPPRLTNLYLFVAMVALLLAVAAIPPQF